jgi:hypothetical protein
LCLFRCFNEITDERSPVGGLRLRRERPRGCRAAAFAVLEETALARSYLSCLAKKVVIVDAPKGTTSSSAEENFGFWIDEPTNIVTFADGKKLNVRRFDAPAR